jgi:hypothetical protein
MSAFQVVDPAIRGTVAALAREMVSLRLMRWPAALLFSIHSGHASFVSSAWRGFS